MAGTARDLFREALALPETERADLAAELLASLDGLPDADWEESWSAEIDRRVEAARLAGDSGIDWVDARREILAKLGAK